MLKQGFLLSIVLHLLCGTALYYAAVKNHLIKQKTVPVQIITVVPVQKIKEKETVKQAPIPPKPIQKIKPVTQKQKPIIQKLTPKLVENSIPIEKKIETPTPKTIEKPIVKPIEKPIEKPIVKPISKPVVSNPSVTANIQKKYLNSIYQIINKHKVYPEKAKNLGKEGVVKISFLIMKDGTITNISINTTSGYLDLDDATKQILIDLVKVDSIPKELNKDNLSITFAINYSL